VLLIVLDTVRGDRLGVAPNLTRLSARGVRFDRALSTAPWTAPSHASMFTGRWPHELSVGWNGPLDATYPTLAEFLAARGYHTAGFVANTTYCSYETGLVRGFTHYEDYEATLRSILLCSALVQRSVNFLEKHHVHLPAMARGQGHRKSAARINARFLDWLEDVRRREPGRPFFAFLNYYDAHHPYLLPDAEQAQGTAAGSNPSAAGDVGMLKRWWDLDKRRLSARDVDLARTCYDRCITSLDHQLGRLLDELTRRGLLHGTLVVVTADHGEHLGEQQLFGHGCSLYLPEIHVPLLVLRPGVDAPEGARVVTDPVSLRDLAATIVQELGPEIAGGSPFPGHSWFSARARPDDVQRGPVLSELHAPPEADPNNGRSPVCRGPMRSIVEGRYHYIQRGDGREELYDLERDPGESRDVAREPDAAGALPGLRMSLERERGEEGLAVETKGRPL
jgi:arylsulfatase A-like enzyme